MSSFGTRGVAEVVRGATKKHGPGTVVIPVADGLRYPEFFLDYCAMHAPEGTFCTLIRSAAITSNINAALREMPAEHEWAWIMGDDHVWGADLLMRLLDSERDIVVPLCAKRNPPYSLVIMREVGTYTDDNSGREYPSFVPYRLSEVPDEPFTVVAAGSAGMLIRRAVLEAMDDPIFESTDGAHTNEDLNFCLKARAAGFEIWCEPHAYLGHIGQVQIFPTHMENGQLGIKLNLGGPPGMFEVTIGEKPELVGQSI